MMHLSTSLGARSIRLVASLTVWFLAVSLLFSRQVTAYNTTGEFNTTLTVWNPSSNSYTSTSLNVNLGVTLSSSDNSSEWQDQKTGYVVKEEIWVDNTQNSKLCTAPYTLCALAFTGGIGNTVIQNQTDGDPGDCSTLFSSTCASDLKAAVGTAILSEGDKANATAILSGDVCLALSTSLKIPGSCSEVTDVLSHRTAQALLTPMSFCDANGLQPFTIESFSAPIANESSVQNRYQQLTQAFTPIIIVSLGGPNGTQILQNEPATTRSLMCIRPDNNVADPNNGVPATGPPASALGAWGIRNFDRPSLRSLGSLYGTIGLILMVI